MLNPRSTVKEIQHYLSNIELLLLDKDEINNINKIISLESLVNDNNTITLINEELSDDQWFKETVKVIEMCKKKKSKAFLLQEHIMFCKRFYSYKILEDKLKTVLSLRFDYSSNSFYELCDGNYSLLWKNTSFNNSLLANNFTKILKDLMGCEEIVTVKLLQSNKDAFFPKSIFKSKI